VQTSKLNPAQQEAISHPEGPAIVLAGAGSGKTTVLTQRALWLIQEQNVNPSSILLVTFTNKAAQEIRSRIEAQIKTVPPYVGTFHSFAARMLRQHGPSIGLDKYFTIYDSDDQTALVKNIIKDLDLKGQITPGSAKNIISRSKNDLISASQYIDIARGSYQENVAKIYSSYQKRLKLASAIDFDDLLRLMVKLLQSQPSISQQLQSQFSHVLIDEYQDTNQPQFLLSTHIAEPEQNLFVVGDFSQSIYAWRGADYKNMLKLYNKYPKLKEYKLEQNYRSTQTILDAATGVVSLNTSHPILHLWTDQTSEEKIGVIDCATARGEAKEIVAQIKTNHTQGTPYKEMAILYRTNAQSRQFEEALLQASIPYTIVGGVGFYERKEIKDILSYLRLIVNPNDEIAQKRVEKLGKRRRQKYLDWLEKIDSESLSPVKIISDLLQVTGYLELYKKDDAASQPRIENIYELENVASQFTSLLEFLENIALVQNNTLLENKRRRQPAGVQLMSLHAAKGLEFEQVFIAGLEEGLLPHSSSLMDNAEMEEERRLCYVGMTRAKQKLCLAFARSRFLRGAHINSFPSRFIADISPDLLSSPVNENATSSSSSRRLVPDDDLLNQVLEDEIDIDALIDW
jgi:DNA helicase II / ATP-dependent DNA helicase PcrA